MARLANRLEKHNDQIANLPLFSILAHFYLTGHAYMANIEHYS